MLFKGTKEQCQNLVNWMNALCQGFKGKKFLDLEIRIENGKLETNLFVKPTNLQLFLDYCSNHPDHCKESIIYSQALRVIERCSKPEDAEQNLNKLAQKFKDRIYPNSLVEKKISEAKKSDRKTILQKRKKSQKDEKVRMIFTHNKANPPVNKWIRESRKCLMRNEEAKKMGDNIQVGWKQPKNLKRTVSGLSKGGPKKPPPSDNPGCLKCGRCRVSCPILKEGKYFKSTNTSKRYPIRHQLNCDSSFVIYLATCKKCQGQYIGKSQTPFKKRHSDHKQEIKNKIGGLGHHYGGSGCGYSNVSIQLIDQVEVGNVEALAQAEVYWQEQLRGFIENGGNAHCRRKERQIILEHPFKQICEDVTMCNFRFSIVRNFI